MKPVPPEIVIGVLVTAFVAALYSGAAYTIHSPCGAAGCFTASTGPIRAGLFSLLSVALFFYPQETFQTAETPIVGVRRRIIALFIDLQILFVFAFGPLVILALGVEGAQTGAFHWSVSRNVGRLSDLFLVLGDFLALALYFVVSAKLNRQTLGQYLCGFRLEPIDAATPARYGMNFSFGIFGLFLSWISLIQIMTDEDKLGWWNRAANVRLVRGS